MNNLYLLLFVSVFLNISCNNKPVKENKRNAGLDNEKEIQAADADKQDVTYNFMNYVENNGFPGIDSPQPIILSQNAKLYALPDVNSEVLRTLRFGERIRILEYGSDFKPQVSTIRTDSLIINNTKYRNWYKISSDDSVVPGQILGYVDAENVAIRFYHSGDLQYLASAKGELKLFKHNWRENKVVDSLILPDYRTEFIYVFNRCALPGVDFIFSVGFADEFCGGSTGDAFIAVINGKLTKIASSEGFLDDDPEPKESTGYAFYFPIKFDNGKLILVNGGNLSESAFSMSTGEFDTCPIPKSLNFPAEQLVAQVFTTSTPQPVLGNKKQTDDEQEYNYVTSTRTQYYRWQNSKLNKVDF